MASILSLLDDVASVRCPLEELEVLKSALFALPLSMVADMVEHERIRVIFTHLTSERRDRVELCVDIIERFLLAVTPMEMIHNYNIEILQGLSHANENVKVMYLTQIGRVMEDEHALAEILTNHELIRAVIRRMGDEKIAVAKKAHNALFKMTLQKPGLEQLFQTELLDVMRGMMSRSDIVRYRIYGLAVEIACTSPASLVLCVNSGVISLLLSELTGDDVLMRVTAMEMVSGLALCPHGRQYLAHKRMTDRLASLIATAKDDPFASVYIPALVKFFGKLAILDSPESVCQSYPIFHNKVLEMALDTDQTMVTVAFDTLGALGSSAEGKRVLKRTGDKFKAVLAVLGENIRSATTDFRIRCMETVAQILILKVEDQTKDLLAVTESWFYLVSDRPMNLFFGISTQPIPELNCAAMRVFRSMAPQPWGQEHMVNAPGFMEYLLDRSSAQSKEAKDVKFELVELLVNSPTALEIMGGQNFLNLKLYQSEGPYHVTGLAAFDTEGED